MESNQITSSERILTRKDINNLAVRSVYLQASFNYERMQSGGFMFAQIPLLKKNIQK